jgi:hypothetical protein
MFLALVLLQEPVPAGGAPAVSIQARSVADLLETYGRQEFDRVTAELADASRFREIVRRYRPDAGRGYSRSALRTHPIAPDCRFSSDCRLSFSDCR